MQQSSILREDPLGAIKDNIFGAMLRFCDIHTSVHSDRKRLRSVRHVILGYLMQYRDIALSFHVRPTIVAISVLCT